MPELCSVCTEPWANMHAFLLNVVCKGQQVMGGGAACVVLCSPQFGIEGVPPVMKITPIKRL